MMYKMYIKRGLDFLIAFWGLLILCPLFLLLALLIKVKLGSPIFFKQLRPGKDKKLFTLYKFRTMTDAKDVHGILLPDVDRLTTFGNILRSTSLDELPELWNILKGEMAIVGPRPLLVDYLVLYNEQHQHRHDVRPGITGYAQVHGRNQISWEEKFDLDILYIRKISFFTDMKILLTTIKAVLLRKGIHSATCVTMEPFTGYTYVSNVMKQRNE